MFKYTIKAGGWGGGRLKSRVDLEGENWFNFVIIIAASQFYI